MFPLLLVVGLVVVVAVVANRLVGGSSPGTLRDRIVSVAESQIGYATDPAGTYCNRFSAYWGEGTDDCGNGNADEEWCADFAAWVWKEAGALVSYQVAPGYLNSNSASFYVWGVDHDTWHAVGSGYVPQPGDVAIYGLEPAAVTATHVAVVTGDSSGSPVEPDVVNGDGDRTGYSVVETGTRQAYADVKGRQGALSGYVSPSPPVGGSPTSGVG